MFHHIPVNIAYPVVKNDDGVCGLFYSLFRKVMNEKLL